ncbi:type III-B CRISPR module RAMP protein Cmr6 [Candidatus Poribacteria bacterium]|nr:type III-B CRISPR module RAMP protein Cmr6 [Candidatus Poribacteria bacterium]
MRHALSGVNRGFGEHAGLILQRYAKEATPNNAPEKRALLDDAIRCVKNQPVRELYALAFDRWKDSFDGDERNISADLKTRDRDRLIVGLGSQNVLETGLRLHHTYGTPILPGSALKGLAAHYCAQMWGEKHGGDASPGENKPFRKCGQFYELLFGKGGDNDSAVGVITFHDAWITPESLEKGALKLDVMTPHHRAWQNNDAPPTDFDSPIPVSYLSVTGTFHVVVSWSGPESDQSRKWTELAMTLLKDALGDWGVGGKTSSGYGRLVDPIAAQPAPGAQNLVPEPAAKRDSGTAATVKIVEARPKGGFNVQEEGYPQGTLTVGTPPNPLPEIGAVVKVKVHIGDPKRPQYRWS